MPTLRIWVKTVDESSMLPANARAEDGRHYLEQREWDMLTPAPTVPEGLVATGYTLQDNFVESDGTRLLGMYRYGRATAQLDRDTRVWDTAFGETIHIKITYELHIKSPVYGSLRKLYTLIRSGKVEPYENWDAPQISPFGQQTEAGEEPEPTEGPESELSDD